MLRRSLTVCSMTALLLGGTAAAQSPGTLLIGGFGQYTYFGDQDWENIRSTIKSANEKDKAARTT